MMFAAARRCRALLSLLVIGVVASGCRRDPTAAAPPVQSAPAPTREVVIYTALDQEFSEPILRRFEEQTGIKVRAKYDTESTKTVGLVNALRAEKAHPRCDVFWNNEILNTQRLKAEGLLAKYEPKAAAGFPAQFRDPDGTWTGLAARARVFLVNTDRVKAGEEPRGLHDMTDAKWRGQVGLAKPLFGTTASHAACLFAAWGEPRATAFFAALKANQVSIESGNKSVALAVASGKLAFGLTDTDDAIIEVEAGKPVKIVYPDSGPGEGGTLFLPNTLALLAGAPHPAEGQALIEYLLSPEVEIALAAAASAQIPVNPAVTVATRVKTPRDITPMAVDYAAAAGQFATAAAYIENTFLR
jgi:iron(III) transport system substrate-binding protein